MLLALPLFIAVTSRRYRYGGTSAGEVIIDRALGAFLGLRKDLSLIHRPLPPHSIDRYFYNINNAPRLVTQCSTFQMQSGISQSHIYCVYKRLLIYMI